MNETHLFHLAEWFLTSSHNQVPVMKNTLLPRKNKKKCVAQQNTLKEAKKRVSQCAHLLTIGVYLRIFRIGRTNIWLYALKLQHKLQTSLTSSKHNGWNSSGNYNLCLKFRESGWTLAGSIQRSAEGYRCSSGLSCLAGTASELWSLLLQVFVVCGDGDQLRRRRH